MVIGEGANRLEIVATERVPDHLPTPGDTRFTIAVSAEAYSAAGSAWIDAEALTAFVKELQSVNATRTGFAEVESMSPSKFKLRISVIDQAGHTEASGRLSGAGQSLQFRFAFCPSTLTRIASEFNAVMQATA